MKTLSPSGVKALIFRVTDLIFPLALFADKQTFAALKTMLLKIRFEFCCPARAKIDALKRSLSQKAERLTGLKMAIAIALIKTTSCLTISSSD
ncbi:MULTISPECIES: hypothetical protein [Bartonella]|uniref:hypothetical protein n=1 Tax=Bartonella TaxID=773 RepID=UPI0018DB478D|nr:MULTISPECIES: hypothetical protein [Bartonella]MBI0168616.1 hypothetical protein [Bartonella sp. W8167]MBI0175394.1 hypothetical protein [Bartonella apis]